jgi:hypothetical protein
MIAVVNHPVGKEGRVTPSSDDLLATVRGLPVHFDSQFVQPDDTFHRTVTVIQYRCKAKETMSLGLPGGQQRVRVAGSAVRHGPLDQRDVRTRTPLLRRRPPGTHDQRQRAAQLGSHLGKIGIILLAAGCHRQTPDETTRPATTTLDKVWVLESNGPTVPDTSVAFDARVGRTVVLHHARPDNMLFVTLHFPPLKDSTSAVDSVHLNIHPMPGKYGFTLTTNDKLPVGSEAVFSYAVHFLTPAEAAVKYPSPGRFEQLVAPALVTADNQVRFLDGDRPAADALHFLIAVPGSYLLAAPK